MFNIRRMTGQKCMDYKVEDVRPRSNATQRKSVKKLRKKTDKPITKHGGCYGMQQTEGIN